MIGTHKTTVYGDGEMVKVKYHTTDVVSFDNEKIILNTGGWFTNTTKKRMNQASEQFNLGYNVFQKAGEWFVYYKDELVKFEGNTLTLAR